MEAARQAEEGMQAYREQTMRQKIEEQRKKETMDVNVDPVLTPEQQQQEIEKLAGAVQGLRQQVQAAGTAARQQAPEAENMQEDSPHEAEIAELRSQLVKREEELRKPGRHKHNGRQM